MRFAASILVLALGLGALACRGPDSTDPEGPHNNLSWEAAQERGAYGYLVYRSESRTGPFRRINERIVRVPDDGLEAHSYSYTDHDVEPGNTYFYYLDAVSTKGIKQRFSGIVSKTAAATS